MPSFISHSYALGSALHWISSSLRGRGDEFYKNNPEGYDAVARLLLGRDEVAASIRNIVDQSPSHKRLVVDAACGSGIIANALGGSAVQVIGVDACPEILDFARRSKDPSIEFRHGDLQDFSAFEPGSIDVFSMAFACRYIRDLQAFYGDLARSLAPDGMAVITTVGHAKRVAAIEVHAKAAGLSMNVIRPGFRSLFNRMHSTAHAVLRLN